MTVYLVNEETGERIEPGDTVRTFRGEDFTYVRVDKIPAGSSEGRIEVADATGDRHWFYPSVANARLVVSHFIVV